jgi:hypothetical protein
MTRIRVGWKGTEQRSDFRSNFCDGSTVEQRRDVVSSADETSKNRRVEVWLVPKGATTFTEIGPAQGSDITALACPK